MQYQSPPVKPPQLAGWGTRRHARPSPLTGKEIQNSNGKGQIANGKPFEICPLPFDLLVCLVSHLVQPFYNALRVMAGL
jgi:hypothetical protein